MRHVVVHRVPQAVEDVKHEVLVAREAREHHAVDGKHERGGRDAVGAADRLELGEHVCAEHGAEVLEAARRRLPLLRDEDRQVGRRWQRVHTLPPVIPGALVLGRGSEARRAVHAEELHRRQPVARVVVQRAQLPAKRQVRDAIHDEQADDEVDHRLRLGGVRYAALEERPLLRPGAALRHVLARRPHMLCGGEAVRRLEPNLVRRHILQHAHHRVRGHDRPPRRMVRDVRVERRLQALHVAAALPLPLKVDLRLHALREVGQVQPDKVGARDADQWEGGVRVLVCVLNLKEHVVVRAQASEAVHRIHVR
eukprot:5626062-Prymnesium_polylepis.2